jgi:hypothetical protein
MISMPERSVLTYKQSGCLQSLGSKTQHGCRAVSHIVNEPGKAGQVPRAGSRGRDRHLNPKLKLISSRKRSSYTTSESHNRHPLPLQNHFSPKSLYQPNTMLRNRQTPSPIKMTYKLGRIYSWHGDLGR